jgi:hypothetical protein
MNENEWGKTKDHRGAGDLFILPEDNILSDENAVRLLMHLCCMYDHLRSGR